MKPVKDLTVLVIDDGPQVELACRIARDVDKCYYYSMWEDSFPILNRGCIGYGLEGIERVDSPFGPHLDNSDLVVFPGIYTGDLQVYLQERGKLCFGAGLGEILETSRDGTKILMEELELPTNKWWKIVGTPELRKFLRSHKNVHVKVNKYRGTFESFFSESYELSAPKMDEADYKLGALKHIIEFVVEEDLPNRIEIGCDFYTYRGVFPNSFLAGVEIKNKSYLGVFKKKEEFPQYLTEFNDKISETLKLVGYQGFLSTELRVGKDKKSHMIDLCCRQASPPGELYQEFYTNITEIIWNCANGIILDPISVGKYGAQARIYSEWAETNCQPIEFPKEYKNLVKLSNSVYINKKYYVIPQYYKLGEVGSVIGWGDSWQEAVAMVQEVAKSIKGIEIEIKTDSFDKVDEEIEKADKMGLSWI